jgi:hypothetical protein
MSKSRRLLGVVSVGPPQAPDIPASSQATLVGPAPTQLRHVRQSGTVVHKTIAGQETLPDSNRTKLVAEPRGPPNAINRRKRALAENHPVVPSDAPSRNTRARARSASIEPLHPEPSATQNRSALQSVQEGGEEQASVASTVMEDSHEAEYIENYLHSSFDKQLQEETAGSIAPKRMQTMIMSPTSQISQDNLAITQHLSQSIQQEPEIDDDDKLIAELLSSRKSRNGNNSRLSSAGIDTVDRRLHRIDRNTRRSPVVLRSKDKNRKLGPMERKRSDRTTEEEDFPLLDTRAGAVVDYVEKQIWTPLPGTRAAAELRRLSGLPAS